MAVSEIFSEFAALWTVFFTVLGLFFGSFLNMLIDRLPEEKSIVKPGSHCEVCGRPLTIVDLIPVFSYLWLRGRCRSCSVKLPARLPLVELVTGTLFGLLFWHFGFSVELAVSLFYGCLFLVITIVDLERGLILNSLTYPAMAVAVVLSLIASSSEIVPSIGSAAAGGGLGLGIFLLIVMISRGGMGFGDVKLAALIGLVVGIPAVITAVLLAVIVGGSVAVVLLITGKRGRKQSLPFGPYLALAAMVALFWGEAIFDWYLVLF